MRHAIDINEKCTWGTVHETVDLKVLFFTQQVQKNDNEVNAAIMLKEIKCFLLNKSKEILGGKLGSAVVPVNVLLGQQ